MKNFIGFTRRHLKEFQPRYLKFAGAFLTKSTPSDEAGCANSSAGEKAVLSLKKALKQP